MAEKRTPQALDWDTYSARAQGEFGSLIDGNPPEADVQAFLERHPAMVPYPEGFKESGGSGGAHGDLHFAVFTQPPLPGIERPVPDFMRIATDSGGFYPLLVEIEAPSRRVATRHGDPSAAFTHALRQVGDWRHWFSQPAHQIEFRELYKIPHRWAHRPLYPRFVLVFGRRTELEDPGVLAVGQGFSGGDLSIMSFDRLAPSPLGAFDLTVRVAKREFEAVAFSPTFRVGPRVAESLLGVTNKREALDRSAMLTDARRRFLGHRFEFWEKYARTRPLIERDVWE
jgi:hypothetical protein